MIDNDLKTNMRYNIESDIKSGTEQGYSEISSCKRNNENRRICIKFESRRCCICEEKFRTFDKCLYVNECCRSHNVSNEGKSMDWTMWSVKV